MATSRYSWRKSRVTNKSRATAQNAAESKKSQRQHVHAGPYLNRFDQRALAWRLAEIATPYLSRQQRLWLCASIGAGELESALIMLLDRCATEDVDLPEEVRGTARKWHDGYAGTDVATKFADYLGSDVATR